ncbi:arylesterase [Polaribacter sp.]|uniref:arylesterase n=1 Tax=Polaribacter sp. TaxID=1920175 RepID=UPI003F6B73DA
MRTFKNNHLTRNRKARTKNIFLKLCYFSLVMVLFSCKSDVPKKEQKVVEETTKTETKESDTNAAKKIVFFGDSLTAGYGLDDINNAFPGLIQQKIDSLDINYIVVNSGVSGETTAGGKNRIDWVLNEKPSIFVLELGANDGLRGVPLIETKSNLQFIINAVQNKYPETKIVLLGMQIPPNMGQDYTSEFKNIFPDLAAKNDLTLVPFLLENVGGIAKLNQSDGIHPTAKGHQILAENVWVVLKEVL